MHAGYCMKVLKILCVVIPHLWIEKSMAMCAVADNISHLLSFVQDFQQLANDLNARK